MKFYFIKNGLRLIKPLKYFEKQYSVKNYFLNNNTYEAIGKEEIDFPDIFDKDLEKYLTTEYVDIFNTKCKSGEETEKNKISKLMEITFKKQQLVKGKEEAYRSIIKATLDFIKNTKLKNQDISEDIIVSQINEYNLDLDVIKKISEEADKLAKKEENFEYENKALNDEENKDNFNHNLISDRKDMIGFEIIISDNVFKDNILNIDRNNDLKKIAKLKNLFIDKNFNNKLFKVDFLFKYKENINYTSIFFFLDIPKIKKKNNNNAYYYEFKNTDQINKSNIKVYFINPLEKVELFRYKHDGSRKNIIIYSQDYFSFKEFLTYKNLKKEEYQKKRPK